MMLKNFRHLTLGFVMAFAVLTHSAVSMAAQQKAKIVLQVSDNDPAKWNLALNNARNAQDDLGKDNIDIEIVVYGPGIHMLRMEATTATRVTQAIKSGISIVACENTMTAQKINKADMHDAISYVPAGVIQLMKRQQQGWAYIRP
jgi:intracellular sulfur oxidation DsrE/DsrF family protein